MTQKRLPEREEEILQFWKENNIFEKSVASREGGKRFVFFEGPPTANALPATHHVIGRSFKDVIPRFKTMQGFWVWRRAGWDTHGLPVELEVEKSLGLKNKKQIEEYGISAFNKKCKESVWKYKKEWEKLTDRMGFWIDLEDPYITYETSYIENLWNVLAQFWKKKLLFKDFKVVPYCVRCGTAISSHEVAQGYETVQDRAVYVKFKVEGEDNTYLLAWTTTPWTLPGNVALAVGENIDYVRVRHGSDIIIVADERYSAIFGDGAQKLETIKGSELVGLAYEPLFIVPEIAGHEKSHKVYAADFVLTDEGSGIVHTAVMYGVDDFELGTKLGLPKIHTVDQNGVFISGVPVVGGLNIVDGTEKNKETEEKIFSHLKDKLYWFSEDMHTHEYPFCWRCHSPLLYYARDSWFVGVSKNRKELEKNNEKINWVPEYIKGGRFGEWLKEAKDWAISRERYWGTPLPIWQCKECNAFDVVGSLEGLNKKRAEKPTTFVFMRHGEALSNVGNYVSSYPETKENPLTDRGREMAMKAAHELKKENIYAIYSSDMQRTRETAEIIAAELGLPVSYREGLREIDAGPFNGHPYSEYRHYLDFIETQHKKDPDKVESIAQLTKRLVNELCNISSHHTGQKVLVVGHGGPLYAASSALSEGGFDLDVYKSSRLAPGEWREIEMPNWPFNDAGEVDLHRPYIDEIKIKCEKCGSSMQRIKDLADVWFDSGAMPFAQGEGQREYSHNIAGKKKLGEPIEGQFPADYISEGIDQTRGWFYTLHVVSTLLGHGPSYKNVITYGHLLDKKGKKMSKSVGNVVDPWEMMNTYGIDTLRWYFYTVNAVGEPTLFDENGVKEKERKFIATLLNSMVFLETYWERSNERGEENVLDRWVRAEINVLIIEVTKSLEDYDIVRAARKISDFVEDLSNWYIRRSRDRLQTSGPSNAKAAAQKTLFDALLTLSHILAPFTPFVAEDLYGRLMTLSGEEDIKKSVHLSNWPAFAKQSKGKEDSLENMNKVRHFASIALAARAQAGIKVRQPLASVTLSEKDNEWMAELSEILKDEVNVKEILYSKNLSEGEVKLDTTLTSELKHEGSVREVIRAANSLRKAAGLTPKDRIVLFVAGGDFTEDKDELLSASRANEIVFEKDSSLQFIQEVKAEEGTYWVGIKKV